MTAAALSIDPTRAAKYPIRIAEELLRSNQQRKRYTAAIQYNHKPKLSQSTTKTTIKPSQRPGKHDLSIRLDRDGGQYLYSGSQDSDSACVLIYDPNTDTLSLDKLDSNFSFNLQSTPTNTDSKKLELQYPYINKTPEKAESEADDGLFGDVAEEAETGDPKNPYDYRHFLHAAKRQKTASPEPALNLGLSPELRMSFDSSRLQRSTQVATKPKPRPKPQARRPPSPPHKEDADADNEDSDDGLIIEMEPETKRRTNRFMGAFDRDNTSTGPISLRSATSSMSPAARILRRPPSAESDQSENKDVIDDLKLPSPQRSPPGRTPQQEAENEADLEAELEMAFGGEQPDAGAEYHELDANENSNPVGPSLVVHDESSEESEEE